MAGRKHKKGCTCAACVPLATGPDEALPPQSAAMTQVQRPPLPVAPTERPFKRGRGRPSLYTPELVEEIIDRIVDGQPLAQICRLEHMPNPTTIWNWEQERPEFSQALARARVHGHDSIAADCLDIADKSVGDTVETDKGLAMNGEFIQRSKLRVDTRLKLLACWDPRYSTRVAVEHEAVGNLAAALKLARERANQPPSE